MPTLLKQKPAIRHPIPAHHVLRTQSTPQVLPPASEEVIMMPLATDDTSLLPLARVANVSSIQGIIGSWYHNLDVFGLRHNVQFYGDGHGSLNLSAHHITKCDVKIPFTYKFDEYSSPNQLEIMYYYHPDCFGVALKDNNTLSQSIMKKLIYCSIQPQFKNMTHYGKSYTSGSSLRLDQSLWPYPELDSVLCYDGEIG